MIDWLGRLIFSQWNRKLTALVAAIIIWVLVNHSITVTRTIPNIPVRVLNIPNDKTIEGLLPNGLLSRRMTLTITGRKTTLDNVSPNDLEVITDAAGKGDRWSVQVTKRHLESLNPDIDIAHNISTIAPSELTIQLSPFVTEKIPVKISRPIGEPPQGYLFLDVWPQRLYQTVSGPEKQVNDLKAKGLRLTFDLSKISRQELDALYEKSEHLREDEIRLFIPESWKKVALPFDRGHLVDLNDPEAAYLHLDFLKQELLPLQIDLPVSVFYPLNTLATWNSIDHPLEVNDLVQERHGAMLLDLPLYARNVSRLFLDTVRNNLEITFVAADKELPWSIQFIDPAGLEESYIQSSVEAIPTQQRQQLPIKFHEEYLRARFRNYMREFSLYKTDKARLKLTAQVDDQGIVIVDE